MNPGYPFWLLCAILALGGLVQAAKRIVPACKAAGRQHASKQHQDTRQ